jgi:Family of unknown function (DUF6298)
VICSKALFRLGLVLLAVTAAASGHAAPLRVLSSNPRYVTDESGKAIYLTGSHERNNFQARVAGGGELPRLAFDGYLNVLQASNHNFIRLWTWEDGRREPLPYTRTGPGTARDGRPKFDLTSFNQAYFDELRTRVTVARDRGFYVGVMLFQGWSIVNGRYGKGYVAWNFHPLHRDNNVNGIDGDVDGNGEGEEVHTLRSPTIVALQKTYVRKMIDTLNDLDNIVWEISNESLGESKHWQYEMIDYVRRLESVRSKQHLVWMSATWDPRDADLFDGPADIVSPHWKGGIGDYKNRPPASSGRKVIINDSDHLDGAAADAQLIWKSFARGLHVIVIDGRLNRLGWPTGNYREAMGHTRTYADRMNLAAMTPRGDLTSTGYALANPGAEYLVYQPGSGPFKVSLVPGTYRYEWFDPTSGSVAETGTLTGRGPPWFKPPFGGHAVLHLRRMTSRTEH